MKNFFFLLLLIGFINISSAQNDIPKHQEVVNLFEKHFNNGNDQALFDLFSESMQSFLPLEKAITYFSNLKNNLGKIEAYKFDRITRKGFASYKTTFTNGLFSINIASNKESKITGLFIEPYKENKLPVLEKNISDLILPFTKTWTVTWGGDTVMQNYHVESTAQKNAFDLVITDTSGKSYKTDGKTNEDYYAFGKHLIAPCDAEVVLVVDGIKDNLPGELNPIYVPGNTVILKTSNDEFLYFAHFKQHSIIVELGQKVVQGELLGLCGNSGNSSEPHLHYHMQNVEDMNVATGAKSYFKSIEVNGEVKVDYSPVKGDKVSNPN
ncbi:peptidoglycan DD-metalloendopeptidase family protein [Dokdonia sp. Hel_I_53]|uniref:peptidoglycan DD-metalloendopeptidase family protein n=1 Tax=Dokdonia sp. Hel_I_53 TaxID=1566287 RepID=UPI00119CB373|nr:peptidoglycan DD-metalloendopeptidase family protein [Dokdonia sp. Hel_I_53]